MAEQPNQLFYANLFSFPVSGTNNERERNTRNISGPQNSMFFWQSTKAN